MALAAGAVSVSTACTTARDESFQTGSQFPLIEYRLPETTIKAKIPLTLTACGASSLAVEGDFVLEAEARGTNETFAVTPATLESARIKRGLEIKLHDTGTIASINSENADRTGAILGNVFKFVTSLAGSFFGLSLPPGAAGGGAQTLCNDPTIDALTRVKAIDRAIARQRATLPSKPSEYQANSRMIDRLLAERQALHDGPLHVELAEALKLGAATLSADQTTYSGQSAIDLSALSQWLVSNPSSPPAARLVWTAKPVPDGALALSQANGPARCAEALASASGLALCFLQPVMVTFSATATFDNVTGNDKALSLETKKAFPVPQWGAARTLSITAAVGSSRQVSFSLDKFGRATEMKWTSEARLENLTGTAADLAAQVQGVAAANSAVNRGKAEIDELTTRQTLNRLRACREILDRGGSQCPAEAPVATEPQ